MAYSTGTLAGKYLLPDGTPAAGRVEIIPSVPRILDAAGNQILAGRVKPELDTNGAFSVTLPATDDATLNPSGVTYTVVAKLRHTNLAAVIGVAVGTGQTVQMADVDPGDPDAPVYAAQVTLDDFDALAARVSTLESHPSGVSSVNSHTGAVTLAASDVGADPAGAATSAVSGHVTATDPHGDRAYTTTQINALVNGAPGTLDTLKEIADQLASDESAAGALATTVAGKLAKSANLSDLADIPTARANLGVAPAVTQATAAAIYVHPTQGNDSNDGLSWGKARATIASALSLAFSGFANAVEIRLSAGVHNVTSTIVVPQAVNLVGAGPLLSQQTEIVWTGADDGSYVIRTAGDTSGNDFTWGQIGGFLLRTAASKPGGGSYTNVNGIYARNMQNAARLHDIRVQNFPGKGIRADWSNAGVPAAGFPGYCTFERVWSTGNNVNWHMFGGFTSVLLSMCAGDVSSNTTDVFIIDPPLGGSNGGRGANYMLSGFKSEDNGTPTGSGADPNYFTINTDVSIGFDGCSGKRGLPGTKPWINYTATPASQNAVVGGIPVDVRNSHTSNFPVMVQGPDGANWVVPAVGSGGQSFQVTHWSGQATAPKKWRGTHSGFAADGATLTGASTSSPVLSAQAAPGATANVAEFGASVFSQTFTAADSTNTVPAPDTGSAGTANVGTWGVSGNKGYLSSTTHKADYSWPGTAADGTLYADLTRSSGQARFGLSVRRTDTNNRLNVYYKSTTGELLMEKIVSGTPTGLKATNVTWAAGATKRLAVTMLGAVITTYLDGVQVWTYTLTGGDATAFTSPTGFGLSMNGNVTSDSNADDLGSRFDNVAFVASVVRINTAGQLQVMVSGTWTTVTTGGLLAANNLSDLASATTARTNLGLGTAAVTNTGTGSSNTILGNDTRLTDSRTPTAHASTHASGGSDPLTLAESQVTNLTADLAAKAPLDATLNAQTGTTYTLVAGDDGKVVTCNNASAITLTVPQNSAAAIPVGSYIEIVQLGAGQVTLAQGAGATLNSRGGALKIAGQYGVAGLRKIATDTFVATGDLTT